MMVTSCERLTFSIFVFLDADIKDLCSVAHIIFAFGCALRFYARLCAFVQPTHFMADSMEVLWVCRVSTVTIIGVRHLVPVRLWLVVCWAADAAVCRAGLRWERLRLLKLDAHATSYIHDLNKKIYWTFSSGRRERCKRRRSGCSRSHIALN